jgi:hypothetical protein
VFSLHAGLDIDVGQRELDTSSLDERSDSEHCHGQLCLGTPSLGAAILRTADHGAQGRQSVGLNWLRLARFSLLICATR